MVPLVGDRGAGGVAVCLFAGGAGFVLQEGSWVESPAGVRAGVSKADGTRRTGVVSSLSLPTRRIPVVYEQRWISEVL
jgi:hypothetical protein